MLGPSLLMKKKWEYPPPPRLPKTSSCWQQRLWSCWAEADLNFQVMHIHTDGFLMSGSKVIKLFSCSTQLNTKFQLLIKIKIMTNKEVSCFKPLRCCIHHANKCLDVVFITLINVKMSTTVGILTFMSRINFVLSWVEHEKSFRTSRAHLTS